MWPLLPIMMNKKRNVYSSLREGMKNEPKPQSGTTTERPCKERQAVLVTSLLPSEPSTAMSHLFTNTISTLSQFDCIIPGIYLTKNFVSWTEENLHANGFTHVIIIDKHVQELYYPSPVFKLSSGQSECSSMEAFGSLPFDEYCQPAMTSSLSFGKEFEAIDLNFGEKSYFTTVLPNCYKAIKFISKALQAGGRLLVIDCNGGEQKCLTIIVAYLMYKLNLSFKDAFAKLKEHYDRADLDRFYMSQLYEYEPILKVQREQSRGHSCSRGLHAALWKRKNLDDETHCARGDKASYFFDTLNPLSQLYASQQNEHTNGHDLERLLSQELKGQLLENQFPELDRERFSKKLHGTGVSYENDYEME